jgi:hypothetical protein
MDALEDFRPDGRVLSQVFGFVLGLELQQLAVALH